MAEPEIQNIEPLQGIDWAKARLGVSKNTIRKYIRTRGLPAGKIGNKFVFRPSAVEAWIEAETGPKAAAA